MKAQDLRNIEEKLEELTGEEMTTIGYKWLNDSNESSNGNEQPWKLDVWKEWPGKLELCHSGYHATRTPLQSLEYVYGNRWYIVEAEGQFIEAQNDKYVCNRMRIIHELPAKEIMLRFAIACAKNSLFRFEQYFPDDNRPRKAIKIVEAFLLGKATKQEIESAARSAESAARSAARSAAWSAARSAAWSAARSAARSAAESAESAARSAAWSAAESAESAARSAARSAAWSAAESAERKWQNRTLERIIREY